METSVRSEMVDEMTGRPFKIITEQVPEIIDNKMVMVDVNRRVSLTDSEIDYQNFQKTKQKSMVQEAINTEEATGINGWDSEANKTIKNWFYLFKEYRYRYQYIYDRNMKQANILSVLSAISSAVLGVLSAFKLWQDESSTFRVVSDISLMLLNFGIAVVIAISKRMLDDVRNEKIRKYIEQVDRFLGVIGAQALKTHTYRMNAKQFFDENNDTYTKLFSDAPNLSISELRIAKEKYKLYEQRTNDNIQN